MPWIIWWCLYHYYIRNTGRWDCLSLNQIRYNTFQIYQNHHQNYFEPMMLSFPFCFEIMSLFYYFLVFFRWHLVINLFCSFRGTYDYFLKFMYAFGILDLAADLVTKNIKPRFFLLCVSPFLDFVSWCCILLILFVIILYHLVYLWSKFLMIGITSLAKLTFIFLWTLFAVSTSYYHCGHFLHALLFDSFIQRGWSGLPLLS